MSTPVKYLIQVEYNDMSAYVYENYIDSFEEVMKKVDELNATGTDRHSIPCKYSAVEVPTGEYLRPLKTTDNVNHPKLYNTIDGIECLDVAETFNFNLGNAIKYIWRSSFKGKQLEDLKKAAFYVNREIERLKHETKN